jgi:hypothetical protein
VVEGLCRITALKNDLQGDGFCMQDFYATESAFLSVCFTYNLLSLYQHASAPEQRKAGFKRPEQIEFLLRLHGLWEAIIQLPRPPPFDIGTMEPIEPP